MRKSRIKRQHFSGDRFEIRAIFLAPANQRGNPHRSQTRHARYRVAPVELGAE